VEGVEGGEGARDSGFGIRNVTWRSRVPSPEMRVPPSFPNVKGDGYLTRPLGGEGVEGVEGVDGRRSSGPGRKGERRKVKGERPVPKAGEVGSS